MQRFNRVAAAFIVFATESLLSEEKDNKNEESFKGP